jgi:hypothetical protein
MIQVQTSGDNDKKQIAFAKQLRSGLYLGMLATMQFRYLSSCVI